MLTELSCKAKIAQFNDASFGDENIFRLHVSMNTPKFEDCSISRSGDMRLFLKLQKWSRDHKPRPFWGSNFVFGLGPLFSDCRPNLKLLASVVYCLGRLDSKRVQNLVMLSSAVEFFQIFKAVT